MGIPIENIIYTLTFADDQIVLSTGTRRKRSDLVIQIKNGKLYLENTNKSNEHIQLFSFTITNDITTEEITQDWNSTNIHQTAEQRK